MPTTGEKTKSNYFAPERWPKWDFKLLPPGPSNYQVVRKTQTKIEKKIRKAFEKQMKELGYI